MSNWHYLRNNQNNEDTDYNNQSGNNYYQKMSILIFSEAFIFLMPGNRLLCRH